METVNPMNFEFAQPKIPADLEKTINELALKHESRQDAVREKITDLRNKIEAKKIDLLSAFAAYDDATTEINENEKDTFDRICAFIAEQNESDANIQPIAELQQEFNEIATLLGETEDELHDRSELAEIEHLIKEFYQTQIDQLKKREKERLNRDIATVSRNHDTMFAHGLLYERQIGSESISVLKPGVSWKQMLNIVIGFPTELAASSMRNGRAQDRLYYAIGLFLKGGTITLASNTDATTMVQGMTRSSVHTELKIPTDKEISMAITGRNVHHHNEFIVTEPTAGGFYIDETRKNDLTDKEQANLHIDLNEVAREIGLPVYIRKIDGFLYATQYSEAEKKFKATERIDIDTILNNTFAITESVKRQAREEVFADCPFKLNLEERDSFEARTLGFNAYRELDSSIKKDNLTNSLTGDGRGLIRVTNGNTERTSRPCTDIESYTKGMEEIITSYKNQLNILPTEESSALAKIDPPFRGLEKFYERDKKIVEDKYNRIRKSLKEMLTLIAFHTLGFGDAALADGNEQTYQFCVDMATPLVSIAGYQDIISRRLGPDGKFRITSADLKHIFAETF